MREHLPDGRLDWNARTRLELTADERALVSAYMDAHENLDINGLASLLREDLRFSMPPNAGVFIGRDENIKGWLAGGFGTGDYSDFRCLATSANGQPAVAAYVRRPGDTVYRAFAMDVLRVADGLVAEITAFDEGLFPEFGLPDTLESLG